MREAPSLDELRTWPEVRLLATRDEALLAERQAGLTRMNIDRILDERGAMRGRDANEWVSSSPWFSDRSLTTEERAAGRRPSG